MAKDLNCPELSDREWIIEQKRAGLHNPDIAEKLGVSESAVQAACKRLNIKLPLVFVHNPELKAFMPREKQS
ncbi:winged helix-turn-helix transcriptional regulator [Methanofollis ethanolicus]|uniref:winged helix-turn-helix transcriptional regulator n=1 Tax=Methanofollis ethanolicus TaxID=488124 RepID=UPI000831011E|nr:winged helix-turn-helix transcriptional regulator [Methanofollis ethanolicus]